MLRIPDNPYILRDLPVTEEWSKEGRIGWNNQEGASTIRFGHIGWVTFLAIGPVVTISLGIGVALTQDHPSRTVGIVVSSSPGGGSDLARTLAAPLVEMLGRLFIDRSCEFVLEIPLS